MLAPSFFLSGVLATALTLAFGVQPLGCAAHASLRRQASIPDGRSATSIDSASPDQIFAALQPCTLQ